LRGIPASDFFIYQNELYAYLNSSPNVVKMWTGLRDFTTTTEIGVPISATLNLGERDYGDRSARKELRQYYIEGEMDESGSVTFSLTPENGSTRSCTVTGTEEGLFDITDVSGTFGDEAFGLETFGPSGEDEDDDLRTFRVIFTTTRIIFYEVSLSMTTSSYFKLLAHGPRVTGTLVQQPLSKKRALNQS